MSVIIIAMIIILLLAIFGAVIIWETASASNTGTTILIVKGDYVLVDINMENYLSLFYNLTFEVTRMFKNVVVILYDLPCDQLQQYEDKKLFMPFPSLSSKHYFSNCSEFSPHCPIDEYVYQVRSSDASVIYNITVDPFIIGETTIRILVFNDEKSMLTT